MVPQRALARIGVAAIAAVLIAGACGSSSSSSSTNTLASVLKNGTLRVGTISGNAPFEALDSSGNLVGYDIDIANLLAERLGVKAEFIQGDTASRVTSVQTGKADIAVGSFTRNGERSQVISFTDAINLEYIAVIADVNAPFNSVSEMNKPEVRVAVGTGSTQETAVKEKLPNATAVVVPGMADEISAVVAGKADAACVANTQIGTYMDANPGKFKVIEGALSDFQEDAIGLPINDFAWWLYVNQFVHDINSNGTTYLLYQKWFGAGTSPGPFSQPPAGT